MDAQITILRMMLISLVQVLFTPFFWILLVLVVVQYRRLASMNIRLSGSTAGAVLKQTAVSTVHGIAGGLVGSVIMVLVGVSLTQVGVLYLWIVALMLMLINPRYLCFSYAGGLVSVSSILFGFPRVDVPQLMGLVAVLHMVESVLIYFGGHHNPLAVYAAGRTGETAGAFLLQKFWPVPVVAFALLPLSAAPPGALLVEMPDWWPLIKPSLPVEDYFYAMMPVAAGLGYGDIAMAEYPRKKAQLSAANLAVYSGILLILAILSSHYDFLLLPAALFAPLGHELVVIKGRWRELAGEPLFVDPEGGVMVLEVVERSPASRLGLVAGDIIEAVNGRRVDSREEFAEVMESAGSIVEVAVFRRATGERLYRAVHRFPGEKLGIIMAPSRGDPAQVNLAGGGLLARWRKRNRK